jgi:hypothetical protein
MTTFVKLFLVPRIHRTKTNVSVLAHFLACGLFLICANLLAQSGRGGLTGTVRDSSGAIVANASITLTEIASQTKYYTVSNADGLYSFPELQVGTYNIAVSAPGFKQYVQNGITISVANTSHLDIALQIGSRTESVTVSADAQQLQTESSDIGTTVPAKLIEELPLQFNGQVRSPLTFVALTPGFAGSASGSPTQQGGFKLNGGQIAGTEVLLDGASLDFASPNLQENYGISPDAVNEFKVLTNTPDAQYGRISGGFVNLVTKSGTNDIHGAAYDLLKNAVLDANTWDNNHKGIPRPKDTQNDFGAFAAGPVWLPKIYDGRGKTFWFFSYEGFRYNTGGVSLSTAPLPAWQNGDFSAIMTPDGSPIVAPSGNKYQSHQLYDYLTCTGANSGNPCTPFAGNQIPASRLDPFSKAVWQYLPKPDADKQNQPYENLTVTNANHYLANLYTIKIDQNIRSNQRLSGSYDYDNIPQNFVSSLGALYAPSTTNQRTRYVRLSYDYTISPTLLNHLNFGYSRRWRAEWAAGAYHGNWPSKLGLKGVADTDFPRIGFNNLGPTGIPTPPEAANLFADNSYQFNEDLSWSHGKHNFRFGVDHRRQEFNIAYLTGTSGEFQYDQGVTSATPAQNDPNSGFAVASFFLGGAAASANTLINSPQQLGDRVYYWGFYAKDDWKITPKLTANLGFRYEIPEPVREAHSRTSQVNLTLPNPGADNLPGAMEFNGTGPGRDGKVTPQDTYYKSFGPRIGFAYQLKPSTVLRLGYGIYYTNIKINNFANLDSAGFFGTGYTWTQTASPQTPAVIPSEIQSFPGKLPPFIDPTLKNGTTGATVVLSKVARPGTTQNWTLDVEQQLPAQAMVSFAYVGAHGDHLQSYMHDPNQGNPRDMARGACLNVLITEQATNPACAGQTPVAIPYSKFLNDFGSSATVAQALRPYPQFGTMNMDTAFNGNPFGVYTYHALQVQLTKRLTQGLTVLANYTWSKSITNADSDYPAQANWNGHVQGALNVYNLKAEKTLSEYDQPHVINIAYTYELPFGRGKALLSHSNRVVNQIVGGWQLAGKQTYASGTPDTATESGWQSGIFAGVAKGDTSPVPARPNIVPHINIHWTQHGPFTENDPNSRNANPAAFSYAPSFTFGNMSPYPGIREHFNSDEDFSLSKTFPLFTERVNAIFRIDTFNIFNRHVFGCFDNNISHSTFGEATCAGGNRTMQGNFRIAF